MSAVTGNKVTKANATISDLGTFFGLGSATTLNAICCSPAINKWAKYKPIAFERLAGGGAHPQPITAAELGQYSYGLTVPNGSSNPFTAASQSWSYTPPGSTDWCRISDFLNASDSSANAYGYDHNASAPVQRGTFASSLNFNIITTSSVSWSVQMASSNPTGIVMTDFEDESRYYLAFCWVVGNTTYVRTATSNIKSQGGNTITLTNNDNFGNVAGSATLNYCICLCNGRYLSANEVATGGTKFYCPLPMSSAAQATGTLTIINATLAFNPNPLNNFVAQASPSGYRQSLQIESNTTWTMTITGGVFTSSLGTSYNGSSTVSFYVYPQSQNKTTSNKTGTITVTDSQNQTITMNLVQEACVVLTDISIDGMSELGLEDARSDGYAVICTPSNATYTDMNWSVISGQNICEAEVVTDGSLSYYQVTLKQNAQNGDSITIKAVSAEYPSISATKTIAVVGQVAVVPVESVSVSPNTLSIYAGETAQLTATVLPADATNKSVTWTSDDTTIATVDSNGLVTGVASGECGITVTTVDGNYTARCAVSASPARYTFTINTTPNNATVTMTANGQTLTQKTGQYPANTIVSWSVSRPGYTTQSGTQTITGDYTKTITLSIIELVSLSIDGATELALDSPSDGFIVIYNPENTGQKGVTWSITQGATKCSGYSTDINDVGDGFQLTLNSNAQVGDTIEIQATSNIVPVSPATHTISVIESGVVDIPILDITCYDRNMVNQLEYIYNNDNQGNFLATLDGTVYSDVTWSSNASSFNEGSINSSTGVFTVSARCGNAVSITITATSTIDPSITGEMSIIIRYKS